MSRAMGLIDELDASGKIRVTNWLSARAHEVVIESSYDIRPAGQTSFLPD